jgi:hypothetical protein
MVQVHGVRNIADKEKFLATLALQDVAWIVSDLQSKLEIQQRFLSRCPLIEDRQVMRASELWLQMYRRLQPNHRCISSELASVLVREWMSHLDLPFARSKESQKTIFVYLEQLLPILAHTQGQQLIEQWFEDHAESQIRWRSWYELSKWAWSEFEERRFMPQNLVKAALIACDLSKISFQKELVFDLGSALSPIEVELILELAKRNTVTVIRPVGEWIESFPLIRLCYGQLEEA